MRRTTTLDQPLYTARNETDRQEHVLDDTPKVLPGRKQMDTRTKLILATALLAPLAVAQSRYVNDMLALNPLGYWRLDGNANDATGHGNNGTLMNGVTFTGPGGGPPIGDPTNRAAVFNIAQSQYISMPTTASNALFGLDWYHPLTMLIWAKTG
jgi:hypothetical protein